MFQYSLRILMVLPLIIAPAIVFIGRLPVEGTVTVYQQHAHRVESILARSGLTNWTGHSSMGGTLFHFPNGRELKRVESRVLGDAAANTYWLAVRYKTLLPVFGSERVVDPKARVIN